MKIRVSLKYFVTDCSFGPDFGPFGLNSGCQFFFQNLDPSVTRCHGQISCKISENTNDPILKKLNDGWTDRRIDQQTDRQE